MTYLDNYLLISPYILALIITIGIVFFSYKKNKIFKVKNLLLLYSPVWILSVIILFVVPNNANIVIPCKVISFFLPFIHSLVLFLSYKMNTYRECSLKENFINDKGLKTKLYIKQILLTICALIIITVSIIQIINEPTPYPFLILLFAIIFLGTIISFFYLIKKNYLYKIIISFWPMGIFFILTNLIIEIKDIQSDYLMYIEEISLCTFVIIDFIISILIANKYLLKIKQ